MLVFGLFPYRDAVNDLALHFLAKMKVLVVKDIEREDIEFITKVSTIKDSDKYEVNNYHRQ